MPTAHQWPSLKAAGGVYSINEESCPLAIWCLTSGKRLQERGGARGLSAGQWINKGLSILYPGSETWLNLYKEMPKVWVWVGLQGLPWFLSLRSFQQFQVTVSYFTTTIIIRIHRTPYKTWCIALTIHTAGGNRTTKVANSCVLLMI